MDRAKSFLYLLLAIIIFTLFFSPYLITLFELDDFVFSRWSERDLYRSMPGNVFTQHSGAELSHGNGFRLPGGLNYVANWLLMAGDLSPGRLQYTTITLFILASLLFFLALAKITNIPSALLGISFFVFHSTNFTVVFQLWNPALIPHLGVVFTILTFGYITTKKEPLFYTATLVALSMINFHLTSLFLLISLILFSHFFVKKFNAKKIVGCLILVIFVFSPYIYMELRNGAENTRLFWQQWLVSKPSELFHTAPYYLIEKIKRFGAQLFSPIDIKNYTFQWFELVIVSLFALTSYLVASEGSWRLKNRRTEKIVVVLKEHRHILIFSFFILILQCLYLSSYTVVPHYVIPGILAIATIISIGSYYSLNLFGGNEQSLGKAFYKKGFVLTIAFGLNFPAISLVDLHSQKEKTRLYSDQKLMVEELLQFTGGGSGVLPYKTILLYDNQLANGDTIYYPSSFDPLTHFVNFDYQKLSSPSEAPCLMVFRNVPEDHRIRDFKDSDFESYIQNKVFKSRPIPLSNIKVNRIFEIKQKTDILIQYELPNRLCMSSANQRLILSNLEKAIFKNITNIETNMLEQSTNNNNLFLVNIKDRLFGGLFFEKVDNTVLLKFSANQLRGQAPTLHGFFVDTHIQNLEVSALTKKGDSFLLLSRAGLIGKLAQHTPFVTDVSSLRLLDFVAIKITGKIFIGDKFQNFLVKTSEPIDMPSALLD